MKYSMKKLVKFSEIGFDERVSTGTIIDFLQNCSTCQSEELGVGVEYELERHRVWLLNSWQIELKKPIKFGQSIIVTTWASESNSALAHRNFTIALEDKPNEDIVKADSVWLMYDNLKERITRITPQDIEVYGINEKLDMPVYKKKIESADHYEKKEQFSVRKYQLDTNNHMNNAWYVKMAEEYVNDDKLISQIRVEYKRAAKYQDIVVPYVSEDNNRCLIELRNVDNEVYAVIEFKTEKEMK